MTVILFPACKDTLTAESLTWSAEKQTAAALPSRTEVEGEGQLHLQAYVVARRPEHLTFAEHKILRTLLEYAPSLLPVRAFVEKVHELFADGQTPEQARARLT